MDANQKPSAKVELAGRIETIQRNIDRRHSDIEIYSRNVDEAKQDVAEQTELLNQYRAILEQLSPRTVTVNVTTGNSASDIATIAARELNNLNREPARRGRL